MREHGLEPQKPYFARTSRDRRRGASWYRAPPKIELHDLIFRSTVLSSPLARFQPCASNDRLRRDEGSSTSLSSLLSTKRRQWRSESSPLAPLDRGCVEWQPASRTNEAEFGFWPPRFLKQKPVALFCFFSSPEPRGATPPAGNFSNRRWPTPPHLYGGASCLASVP